MSVYLCGRSVRRPYELLIVVRRRRRGRKEAEEEDGGGKREGARLLGEKHSKRG